MTPDRPNFEGRWPGDEEVAALLRRARWAASRAKLPLAAARIRDAASAYEGLDVAGALRAAGSARRHLSRSDHPSAFAAGVALDEAAGILERLRLELRGREGAT